MIKWKESNILSNINQPMPRGNIVEENMWSKNWWTLEESIEKVRYTKET